LAPFRFRTIPLVKITPLAAGGDRAQLDEVRLEPETGLNIGAKRGYTCDLLRWCQMWMSRKNGGGRDRMSRLNRGDF
jgi:hypothetical protein